jgi:acetyl-CoA decarbonylase/synthase complex subunit beta
MPAETKERLRDFIPVSVYPAIATEKDVTDLVELKEFLLHHHHPVVGRWNAAGAVSDAPGSASQPQVFSAGDIPIMAGGFRIILKNAKITAEKVIILPVRPGGSGGSEHHAPKK